MSNVNKFGFIVTVIDEGGDELRYFFDTAEEAIDSANYDGEVIYIERVVNVERVAISTKTIVKVKE